MKALILHCSRSMSALVALLSLVLPMAAAAQATQCGPLDQVVEGLANRWQEAPIARGIQGSELIVMVFADPEGDTWTIVGVSADGLACLLGSGTGWEALPRPAPGVEG